VRYLARAIKQSEEEQRGEKLYTTAEAAKRAGVARQTVQGWIAEGRIKAPELIRQVRMRLWSEEDIAQLRKVDKKERSGE